MKNLSAPLVTVFEVSQPLEILLFLLLRLENSIRFGFA